MRAAGVPFRHSRPLRVVSLLPVFPVLNYKWRRVRADVGWVGGVADSGRDGNGSAIGGRFVLTCNGLKEDAIAETPRAKVGNESTGLRGRGGRNGVWLSGGV
jgi:hypothetical protein